MQDRKAKQRALLTELDALADLRETERVLLLDYAAALGEGGPQMLCAELLRLLMEAAEDARTVAAEQTLRAQPRSARADAVEGVVRAFRRAGKDLGGG